MRGCLHLSAPSLRRSGCSLVLRHLHSIHSIHTLPIARASKLSFWCGGFQGSGTRAFSTSRPASLPFHDARYNGVKVTLGSYAGSEEDFEVALQQSIQAWKTQGKAAVWLQVEHAAANYVPIAFRHGFKYHHAVPTHAMLSLWLGPGESMLPHYCTHQVGVAGFVINDRREVLLIQERNTPYEQKWKLPGGLADEHEEFGETAAREVFEETGIESEFRSIVAFRHSTVAGQFDRSDIYVVCRMHALSTEINRCTTEISACKWMPLQDFANSDLHSVNRIVADLLQTSCPPIGQLDKPQPWACDINEYAVQSSLMVGQTSQHPPIHKLYHVPKRPVSHKSNGSPDHQGKHTRAT